MKIARLILAAVIHASSEAGSTPTFNTTAYTGGLISVDNYDLPLVIDLAGLTAAERILANLEHDRNKVVGHVTAVNNTRRTLELSGVLSYDGPDREKVLASSAGGFPWQSSVEVRPAAYPKIVPAGNSIEVNGQVIAGPCYLVSAAELYGIALVPHGADGNTSVSIAASAAGIQGAQTMSFEAWVASLGLDVASLDDAKKAELMKAYESVHGGVAAAAAGDPAAKPQEAKAARKQDDFDAADIRAAYSDQLDELDAKLLEVEDEVASDVLAKHKKEARKALSDIKAKAARGRWSADRFNAEATTILAKAQVDVIRAGRPTAPAIHAASADFSAPVIEAAFCQTLRVPGHEKQFEDKVLQQAHTQFQARIGLQRMLIMAAVGNGMQWGPGERISKGNLRSVLKSAFAAPDVHAGPSTMSVSRILENVANKQLLAGYEQVDQAWREISVIKPVNDFKVHTSYRLLDDMAYEELEPGGRIKNGMVSDEVIDRQAKTYAKMFSLDRTTIINDDLSAFDDIRNRLGRGAGVKFSSLFWATFLDNSSFFTSGNTNYITGATTNLGTDGVGLGLGVKAFRTMTSPSGDGSKKVGMNRTPSILLVPPELEQPAELLYRNQNLGAAASSGANIYANKYRPVVVSYLSDSTYTGYSTTAWYLLGDPRDLPAMHVALLDGNEAPTVESADADFDQLGIQFRGYHDFGFAKAEYLAGIKSKGAA